MIFLVVSFLFYYLFPLTNHVDQKSVLSSFVLQKASRQQSVEYEQHLHSSTEMNVIGMFGPEEGLDAHGTANEGKQDYTYAVVEKGNRKSRCVQSESSFQEQAAGMPTDNRHIVETDSSVKGETAEQEKLECVEGKSKEDEERKDCVYAIVHIKPGQTTVCKEPTVQGKSLDATCTEHCSSKTEGSEELVNISSFGHGKEITSNEIATEQNPHGGEECKEYLYAVVDKANKKRRPPQVLASCTYS